MTFSAISSEPAQAANYRLVVAADIRCPYSCSALRRHPGYVIEILRAIYEPMGITVDYRVINAVKAIELAEMNKVDAVIGVRRKTAPTLRLPRYEIGLSTEAYAVLRGTKWRYDGVSSLQRKIIGMPYNYFIDHELGLYIKRNKFNRKRIIFGGGEDPVQQNLQYILRKRIDIAINDQLVLGYNIRSKGLDDQIVVGGELGDAQPIYVAFRPQIGKHIIQSFDLGMARLSVSKTFHRILKRYGVKPWTCRNCEIQVAQQ